MHVLITVVLYVSLSGRVKAPGNRPSRDFRKSQVSKINESSLKLLHEDIFKIKINIFVFLPLFRFLLSFLWRKKMKKKRCKKRRQRQGRGQKRKRPPQTHLHS